MFVLDNIIQEAGERWVSQGGQEVDLSFKTFKIFLPGLRVRRRVVELFDRHQLDHVGKMKVAGLVNHAGWALADRALNQIAFSEAGTFFQ